MEAPSNKKYIGWKPCSGCEVPVPVTRCDTLWCDACRKLQHRVAQAKWDEKQRLVRLRKSHAPYLILKNVFTEADVPLGFNNFVDTVVQANRNAALKTLRNDRRRTSKGRRVMMKAAAFKRVRPLRYDLKPLAMKVFAAVNQAASDDVENYVANFDDVQVIANKSQEFKLTNQYLHTDFQISKCNPHVPTLSDNVSAFYTTHPAGYHMEVRRSIV